MDKLVRRYETLRETIINIHPNILKANEGNKAAGKRARKGLQEAKGIIMELRKLCLEATAKD